MKQFLIDSSVWIAFFRNEPAIIAALKPWVESRTAAIAGPIYAELLSGAPSREHQAKLAVSFQSLNWLSQGDEVWGRAAEARFLLARTGRAVGILDILIALAAADAKAIVVTRDRDFDAIRRVVPFDVLFL